MKTVIDWYLADMIQTEIEVSEELYGAMVLNAVEFLKANGSVDWKAWSMLGEASRKAFAEAGERIRVRAVLQDRSK